MKIVKYIWKGVIFLKTVEEIRKELRYIVKFWYNLPDSTVERYRNDDELSKIYIPVVEAYDKHIKNARPTLQKIYNYLYVEGLTQKDTGYYLDYAEKYVQRLNKELILFFQKAFG